MLDLGTLRLGIKVDGDEAKAQLNDVGNAVTDDESKTNSLMASAKNMIKAFAAAYAVKELVKLGKAALDAYADFEQLEGGVQKIFGDEAAAQVMKNAERAYKTAGLSANQYMNTAIGFSGALLKSLEGDTIKGAEMTNMAIQDMSDMANTYGKTVEEVSQTYTSLARGNYQTLDNLFGGMFAGTKTGLQEMLDYAEEYRASMGETVSYSADSYADIVSAIHDVSEATGVAGTTAKEAEKTISGSVNMMKASWENLLIAIGSGDGLNEAINEFLGSLATVAKNIIPRVIEIAGGIVKGIVQAIPQLMQSLADAISNFADSMNSKSASNFIRAGISLIGSLIKGILQAMPQLIAAVGKLIVQMIKSFKDVDLKGIGRAIINSLLDGLKAAWTALKNWVEDKADWIKSKFTGAKNAGNAGGGGSGHRIGLREVPYDGYSALLHKGETILTAAETNQYKKYVEGLDSAASGIVNGINAANMMSGAGSTEARIIINLGGAKVAEQIYRLNKQGQLAFEG
ncbi:MAG: hypothetical protein II544_02150 [Spirochaetales bacterium]|nr:hypothetical protein [Spirochaetales bacterium]